MGHHLASNIALIAGLAVAVALLFWAIVGGAAPAKRFRNRILLFAIALMLVVAFNMLRFFHA